LAAFAALAAGAPAGAVTLQDAIASAVANNPAVDAARANVAATISELDQARGQYLPQLDAFGRAGPGWSDGSDDLPENHDWALTGAAGLTASQMLYDGSGVDAEVERQASRVDSAALRLIERSELIGLDTARVYLDILRGDEVVALARANVARHEQIAADIERRLAGGLSSLSDRYQAQERLGNVRKVLIDAEAARDQQRIAYLSLTGQPARDLAPVPAEAETLPPDVEAAVALMRARSPALASAEADIDTAYAEWKAARAASGPTVRLEGSLTGNTPLVGGANSGQDASVGVVVRYNLYRGGIDTNTRKEQVARIGEARAQQQIRLRDLEQEIRTAWLARETSLRQIPVVVEQVDRGSQVVGAYRQLFNIGQRTLLDLLDSETELFNARVALIGARYAADFSGFRVLATSGVLLETVGVPHPAEAAASSRTAAGVPGTPSPAEDPWAPGVTMTDW
jgi:adhesin transport system outer membrane protein